MENKGLSDHFLGRGGGLKESEEEEEDPVLATV